MTMGVIMGVSVGVIPDKQKQWRSVVRQGNRPTNCLAACWNGPLMTEPHNQVSDNEWSIDSAGLSHAERVGRFSNTLAPLRGVYKRSDYLNPLFGTDDYTPKQIERISVGGQ